jgi:uncharacterized DUF497 family protein
VAIFEWDRNNLRKVRAHEIKREEAEQTLLNDLIPIDDQDVEGEFRFVYYGETNTGRLLGVVATERGDNVPVVTAYDLNARQRRTYHTRRAQGSERNDQEDA